MASKPDDEMLRDLAAHLSLVSLDAGTLVFRQGESTSCRSSGGGALCFGTHSPTAVNSRW